MSRLGLLENEAKIYLSLVEKGAGTVSDIAKRAGLHRPTVYKHIPDLQEKGLIGTSHKGKRTVYIAETPEKLNHLLDKVNEEVRLEIPQLIEEFKKHENKPVMKFYENKAGIREVFEDILITLKRGEVFYRYSSRKEPMIDSYLPKNYRTRRDAKQLERLVISGEDYAKHKKRRLERQIKTVPNNFDLFNYDITLIIYANKVAVIDFNSDTAFVMENPPFASFQKTLFQLLYEKLL